MPTMTSKNWDAVALLFKNHSAEAFPHALNSEDALTFCFSHQQNIPSLKSSSSCPPIFSLFILIPFSAFKPPGFLPLQNRNPLHQHGKHTPHYFSCTYEASSTLQFSACFTTKNPYGFVVGCKEPKPRPKMGPQHFPKPIWSLWAWAM